jgi:hypothetical protein
VYRTEGEEFASRKASLAALNRKVESNIKAEGKVAVSTGTGQDGSRRPRARRRPFPCPENAALSSRLSVSQYEFVTLIATQ